MAVRYEPITRAQLGEIARFTPRELREMRAVSAVVPFRTNRYVLDLIDWDRVPDDPIYRLTFPHRDMLAASDLERLLPLVDDEPALAAAGREIQLRLNPHPSSQHDYSPLDGVQHKYRDTLLFFPSRGQTCHAYCGYCFRWAQFAGIDKFEAKDKDALVEYLEDHPEVTDVIITGGDPLVMTNRSLAAIFRALEEVESLRTIRIGTKALSYWPARFDEELLEIFWESNKAVAVMAHLSHPRELTEESCAAALAIRRAGATIRTQAPVIRGVNDSPEVWRELWQRQVELGMVPYYFFVERDTGPKGYYAVPLWRALDIYQDASRELSGLARTARGPVMSTSEGKYQIRRVVSFPKGPAFELEVIRSPDPTRVGKIFYKTFQKNATWYDELNDV